MMIDQSPQFERNQFPAEKEVKSDLMTEVTPLGARSGGIINSLAQEAFENDADIAAFKGRLFQRTTEAEADRVDALPHRPGRIDDMTYVDYSESGTVSVSPDGRPRFLVTSKLNGCTATVLYRKYVDGSAEVSMTHYAPMALARQKAELAQQALHAKEGVTKESLYILAANSDGGEIARYARETISATLPVVQQSYDPKGHKPDDYGAVVVVLEAGNHPSSVHTWLGAGEIL